MSQQPTINVEVYNRLSPQLSKKIGEVFASSPMGKIAVPWSEFIGETLSDQLEVRFVVARDKQEIMGIGIVYRIRKLNLLQYISPRLIKISAALDRLHLNPLALDVAFLEIPLRNVSGLFLRPDIEAERARATAQVIQKVSRNIFPVQVLCIKDHPDSPGRVAVPTSGEIAVPMLPNARLQISWPSFDAYVASRSARRRRNIRYDQKLLKRCDARIELRQADEVDTAEMAQLFNLTSARANQKGEIPLHLRIGESFFTGLSRYLPTEHRVLCAFHQNTMIGFVLAVVSGDEWILPLCGFDYKHSGPARAYFNLLYATIRAAIDAGARTIEFGITSYEAKKHLGCFLETAGYRVDVRNPLLRAIGSLISRNLGKSEPAAILSE